MKGVETFELEVKRDREREFCLLLCKVANKLPNKTKFLRWPELMLHKSKLFEKEVFGPYIKTLHMFGESAFHNDDVILLLL